jgi:site-specific DNA recombinase
MGITPRTVWAIDYARLSKDRKKLSIGVGIQHKENKAFIEDQGWVHHASFEDNDISASRFSTKPRDGYDDMIACIKQVSGDVSLVLVGTEMARFYRDVRELLDLIDLARTTKLKGIYTTDGDYYDLSTPDGIDRAIGAVSKTMRESHVASVRQKRRKRDQAQKGQYMGGGRAYGFEGPIKDEHDNIINGGRINIAEIPEEIANLKDWWRRLIAGEPRISIIRDLNQRGIPSTNGGLWTVGNFERTVTKKRYVIFDDNDPEQRGTLVHDGAEHRAQWPGLITRQEHELLLNVLKETSQPWGHGLIKGRTYVLTGFVFCGGTFDGRVCNGKVYGNGHLRESGKYQRRYRCRATDNNARKVGCGKVFRDADALEAFVTECVLYRINNPEVAAALAPDGDQEQANELARKLAGYRKELEHKAQLHALGEYDLDEYKLIRSTLMNAIEATQDQLSKLQNHRATGLLPTADLTLEKFKAFSIERQRAIVRLVVDRIIIHPSKPGGHTWKGWRFQPNDVEIIWSH